MGTRHFNNIINLDDESVEDFIDEIWRGLSEISHDSHSIHCALKDAFYYFQIAIDCLIELHKKEINELENDLSDREDEILDLESEISELQLIKNQ